MKLPPLPKWNKTTDDIDTGDLLALAQDHERSLLPSGIIFPRTGEVWEVVRECEVHFVASFTPDARAALGWLPGQQEAEPSVPPISFGRARLLAGEKVRVVFADEPKPLLVWFQPVRYDELHEKIVPSEIRTAPHYSYYRLTLRTAPTSQWPHEESVYFTEAFKLVGP